MSEQYRIIKHPSDKNRLLYDTFAKTLEGTVSYPNMDIMLGKTIRRIEYGDHFIVFFTYSEAYLLEHRQSCCEEVYLENICGDLSCLLDCPLEIAECQEEEEELDEYGLVGSTAYKLATSKGYVEIVFTGTSNGYYEVNVDLHHIIFDEETILKKYYRYYEVINELEQKFPEPVLSASSRIYRLPCEHYLHEIDQDTPQTNQFKEILAKYGMGLNEFTQLKIGQYDGLNYLYEKRVKKK